LLQQQNKNLKKEIEENRFREDLYHRLSVILIRVPSLNERTDDIPLLARHFIELICTEYGMPVKKIQEKAINELKSYNWTGNIREFRNVIERLIIFCASEITISDVKQFVSQKQ
jgi:two-component system, NtrC family, nitrogen regulation response regulator NtrX